MVPAPGNLLDPDVTESTDHRRPEKLNNTWIFHQASSIDSAIDTRSAQLLSSIRRPGALSLARQSSTDYRLNKQESGIDMPYIVTWQVQRTHQVTLEEIWSGSADFDRTFAYDATGTVTRFFERIPKKYTESFDAASLIRALKRFNTVHADLFQADRASLYSTFRIPKKTGGLRRIDAPYPVLMNALRELKELFESHCGPMYHTTAFAYIAGRCTINAVKKHQENQSRWFLKTDFADFFGNTTLDFTMKMLGMIFPFCQIMEMDEGREALEKALSLCFLDGGLPQGTPISPMLTNLIMIPMDHMIAQEMRSKGFVYTRYADDILISHNRSFLFKPVVEYLGSVLKQFDAPFSIKPQKTRYGSSAGSNWNLGVMLNKDNNITVGYRNKRQFKAMCSNFVRDMRNGIVWDTEDVNYLSGLISYYKMAEPSYMNTVIPYINNRHRVNIIALIRDVQGGKYGYGH